MSIFLYIKRRYTHNVPLRPIGTDFPIWSDRGSSKRTLSGNIHKMGIFTEKFGRFKFLAVLLIISLSSACLYILDQHLRSHIPNILFSQGPEEKALKTDEKSQPIPLLVALTNKFISLRWRHLRIAAIVVSVLTVLIISAFLGHYLYKRYWYVLADSSLVSDFVMKPNEYEFYEMQSKCTTLDELRDNYKEYIENDDNFNLQDVSKAPKSLVKTFKYSKSIFSSRSIEYLSTDSYLELVKRISNKIGEVVALLPYTMRKDTVYFSSTSNSNSEFMAVPVALLSVENSAVSISRLKGPFQSVN